MLGAGIHLEGFIVQREILVFHGHLADVGFFDMNHGGQAVYRVISFVLFALFEHLLRGRAFHYADAVRPVQIMLFGEFIGIMSGSLIIESIFAVPGVGSLYINSINGRDYNMFMLLTVFYTAVGLAAGIVVDISYGLIDPRIRMGSRK